MNNVPRTFPTVDEIVATLRHSHLPTILCEGTGDLRIVRFVEERLGVAKVSSMPCNGKTALLAVFDRRHEFRTKRVAFLCDRDMWLFTSIPKRYAGVILTWGYSIENDVYAGAPIERLLSDPERKEHQYALASVVRWFAFEVEKYRRTGTAEVALHVNRILDGVGLSPQFKEAIGFVDPAPDKIQEVASQYQRKLRGKCLFQLLLRYLGTDNRDVKFSLAALLEICVRLQPNPHIGRIIRRIRTKLAL